MWARLPFYINFTCQYVILRRPEPLLYGIVLTSQCNLNCRGCRVANNGLPDLTWQQLIEGMQSAWQRGFRELYFTGGEPMLWRDGEHTMKDVVLAAKQIGFFHVHIYTNGTCGLDTPADMIWVSMDGLPGIYELRRGNHFHQVEQAIRKSTHPKTAVIYVIDRNTASGIEPFLDWMRDTRLPVVGVMFYFHTPYYGQDDLFLSAKERAPIIDRLLSCIRSGFPVINSRAGLLALKSGKWPRRIPSVRILDSQDEYVCCRAPDEVCAECGYAACTEITEFQRLRPSAVLGMLRYW
jgi:MoaA/NifB/PqqE/SkfB family radical SAM enzyme